MAKIEKNLIVDSLKVLKVMNEIALLTTATTLTAKESGHTIVLNSATAFTVTLPKALPGLFYRFKIGIPTTTTGHKITVGNAADFFFGRAVVISSTADQTLTQTVTYSTASGTPTSWDFLTFDGDDAATGGNEGDIIEVHAVDNLGWLVTAHLVTTSANPAAIAVFAAS